MSASSASPAGAASSSGRPSVSDAAQKLKELRSRLDRERQSNFSEVGLEDQRKREDPKLAQKRVRDERDARELLDREAIESQGLDYDRVKSMTTSVAEADAAHTRKTKKEKRSVDGFSDWEDMARRKYKRLTRGIKPDLEHYKAEKERLGDDFYPEANSLSYGLNDKVDKAKMDHMVKDLAKQTDTRDKLSRHRTHDPNADVDYINDRNARFNQWLSRSFDKYTKEIRDNLDRGTAL